MTPQHSIYISRSLTGLLVLCMSVFAFPTLNAHAAAVTTGSNTVMPSITGGGSVSTGGVTATPKTSGPLDGGVKTDPKNPYGSTSAGGSSSGGGGGGGGGQPVRVVGGPGTQADIRTQTNTKKSAAMNTISAKKLGSLERKEYVLDGILHSIVKKITQQLVQSALRWVASGFQGSPMFVTNPQQFFTPAADQVAGQFIYGSALNSLCSPMNVRSALDGYYRASTGRLGGGLGGGQCTLSGSVANVQSFLGGNFMSGGWGGWFSGLSRPNNLPLMGALSAQTALDHKIAQRQYVDQMKWDWGKGFLPKEKCQTVNGQQVCNTTTPGETIAQATNFDLSIGKRELISADELNEVISALMSQLANQALSMAGGLFGLGSASQGSGYTSSVNETGPCRQLSYLDRIGTTDCDGVTDGTNNSNATNASTSNTQSIVSLSVSSELDYQAMNQRVSEAAGDALANADTCAANNSTIADLAEIKTAADGTITQSNLTVQTLLAIQSQYDLGTSDAQSQALANYNALALSNTLHTDTYNATFESTIETVLARVTDLRNDLRSCASDSTTNANDTGGGGN